MKCLDTRWQEATTTTIRRHICDCGVRGKTIESWITPPIAITERPSQPKTKKLVVNRTTDALWSAMSKPTKKQKQVAEKNKNKKSIFEDAEEDYTRDRFDDDLGITIPRGDEW